MQPLFDWLGQFWWLIFPVMAFASGIGRAWQKGLERRHKRRLEILRAKGELKAAQAAARAKPAAAASAPTARAVEETPAVRLERLFAAHDAVTARWLDYELDVAKIIAFPAMSDGRQPLTAAFLRAKRVADGLRPASSKARLSKDALNDYRNAVNDYEVAFDVAERDARRLKDSSFSEVERRRLDTAKQLLTIAIDQAATPAERQLAYRRVRQELDGLISLSDEAIEVLESKVSLELTTGTVTTDASRTPSAASLGVPATAAPPPATGPAVPPPAPSSRDGKPVPWPVPARSSETAPGRVIKPKH